MFLLVLSLFSMASSGAYCVNNWAKLAMPMAFPQLHSVSYSLKKLYIIYTYMYISSPNQKALAVLRTV